MLLARPGLDCTLAGLGLLLQYVPDVVDRTSVELHRLGYQGKWVPAAELGSPGMLAGANGSFVLGNMTADS